MKRKFIILTLCFTLIFTSINYKKTYADGGVISLPILATVSSLAIGTGIVLKNNDDLYDLGLMFYDYIKTKNDMTWDILKSTFNASVVVLNNNLVSVDSKFLDIVKGFFDNIFNKNGTITHTYIPMLPNYISVPFGSTVVVGDFTIKNDTDVYSELYYKGDKVFSTAHGSSDFQVSVKSDGTTIQFLRVSDSRVRVFPLTLDILSSLPSLDYEGGYTWDNVESKKENESIALPIPGNLGQLVGQDSLGFWDNTNGLVGTGVITIPNVDNPSISVDNTDSFPKVEDVPDVDVPDVDVPNQDIIIPSFPSFGDSLDFSPMYLTNVTEKFPFSLPWDIGRLIQKFDVSPVAPVFDIPIVSETITLDLTDFDELASIVRFFVLIGFVLSLIFISTRLLG